MSILNPLVDYSGDFVGDYDPNVLSAEDIESLLHNEFDLRDPYALQKLRSAELQEMEGEEVGAPQGKVTQQEVAAEGYSSSYGMEYDVEAIKRLNASTKSVNTVARNRWATSVFDRWRGSKGDDCSRAVQDLDDSELNKCLPVFIHEVRRLDGDKYPPNSLVTLIAGMQQTICEVRKVDFFRGDAFHLVRESLDAAMKIATKEGIGLNRRNAEVLSYDDEEKLWEKVLGSQTPEQLIRTLFYLNGLHFALRGGQEHSQLSIDQFRLEDRDGKRCLVYKEMATKTNAGGLSDTRYKPKEVIQFPNETNPARCHVRMFELFLRVRPSGNTRFYLLPAKKLTTVWYTNRPIGKNQLCKFLADMCNRVGVRGRKTNHSLRATCATRLYQAGVEEQQIMERTGHRSVVGVRTYKRTSDVQMSHTSAILDNKKLREVANESSGSNFTFNNCSVVINN